MRMGQARGIPEEGEGLPWCSSQREPPRDEPGAWPARLATPPESPAQILCTPGLDRLQYQPISSLVTANSGDRVLLRFVNLGYTQGAMTLDGIPMRVVGKDATLLRGRDGTDLTYMTDVVYFGAGESFDVIFIAPAVRRPS